LLIAVLSGLAVASIFVIIHHTHRRMPARQVAEGDARDISAPLPMHLRNEQDLMTDRELQAERERGAEREPDQPRAPW
jgi:DNA-binding cell septation regulator SpoVG